MGPESLSPEDATLLCATTPATQLQIGALCRFEGGPLRDGAGRLRVDELRAHVVSRLHLIPRFRQRIQQVPLDLARPVWVDDTVFEVDRHFHVASIPAPGGDAELRRFVGDLLGRPLDRARPLWDIWLVDGLDDGDVAVVVRADHVVADGLSLLNAAVALLDLDAATGPGAAPVPWQPTEPPGAVDLVVRGLVDRGCRQVGLALGAARTAVDPRRVVRLARSVVGSVSSPAPLAPTTPLTGAVGTRRDVVWTSLALGSLREVAHAHGVTVNDVLLAAVTGALRRIMGPATADTLAGRQPRVLVPVGDAASGVDGNVFSFVVAGLPVHLGDPEAVLDAVHAEMAARKAGEQSVRISSVFSVVDVVPVGLLRWVAPGVLARQPLVNLAVTNLPGSEVPLYLYGSRLRRMHPIITGVGNIACIIGALSYRDELAVAVTVDPDVVPDADGLLRALVEAAAELGVPVAPR